MPARKKDEVNSFSSKKAVKPHSLEYYTSEYPGIKHSSGKSPLFLKRLFFQVGLQWKFRKNLQLLQRIKSSFLKPQAEVLIHILQEKAPEKEKDRMQKILIRSSIKRGKLFLGDSFCRAGAYTSAAVNAFIGVNDSFSIVHGNCADRASAGAGFTTKAFFLINFCSHDEILQNKD